MTTFAQTKTSDTQPAPALSELETDSWSKLVSAFTHKKKPEAGPGFRFMTFATCTKRGADARMVVLRKVDVERKYVWFYTDARTKKVLELEAFPMATLLFWDEDLQTQLRLSVETRLHTDDYIADEHWQQVRPHDLSLYLSEPIPGSELAAPYPGFPERLIDAEASEDDRTVARQNFAVIECRVLAMEFLHLSRNGQTRACFQYEPESRMTWLAP